MIRESVLDGWHAFSLELEGRVPHMYLDVLGLVTTGVGNLIDSKTSRAAGLALALELPWRRPGSDTLASEAEVEAQWTALRAAQGLRLSHYRYARDLLEKQFGHALTLTDPDIDALVARRLRENASHLERRYFPAFSSWPADAQLATLSMAWAMGSDFPHGFPNFTRCARAFDWRAAAVCCEINARLDDADPRNDNPGVIPRNDLNRAHFVAAGSDLARWYPEVLHGPCTLKALRAGWKQAGPIVDDDPEPAA